MRSTKGFALVATCALGASVAGLSPASERAVTATSARQACPTAVPRTVSAHFAAALGDGPAYVVLGGRTSTLRHAPARSFSSRHWGGQKVVWLVRPGAKGPLMVRGRRVGGPEIVRFERGDIPPDHLTLTGAGAFDGGPDGGWRSYPSYTRLRTPGCHRYTVGGPGVHETIVFRATAASPVPPPAPHAVEQVSCDNIVDSVSTASAGLGYRVVLGGAVAVPPAFLGQNVALPGERWPYWRKAALIVHANRGPVTITVPLGWRRRAAITWGNGLPPASSVRIGACAPAPKGWNVYVGGFFTRSASACVPLVLRIDSRSERVRFGIARHCGHK